MRLLRLIGKARKVRSSRAAVRWLFLRALGAVYLIAFTSLRVQVLGLYGSRGIRPIRELLAALRAQAGRRAYRLAPSLLWLGSSDRDLVGLCRAGQVCSLALLARCGARSDERRAAGRCICRSSPSGETSFHSSGTGCCSKRDCTRRSSTATRSARGTRAGQPPWLGSVLMRWLAFRLQFPVRPRQAAITGSRPGGAVPPAPTTTRRSRCRRASAGTRTTCRGPFTACRPRRRSPSSSARRSSCSRRGRVAQAGILGARRPAGADRRHRQLRLLQRPDRRARRVDARRRQLSRPASAGPRRPPPGEPAARPAGSRLRADRLRRAGHAARHRVHGDVRRSSAAPPAADAPHAPWTGSSIPFAP